MRMLLVTTMLLLWGIEADAATARRVTRCCIMVAADGGGQRPYCFNIETRPARRGRRACRVIGGEPQRTAAAR